MRQRHSRTFKTANNAMHTVCVVKEEGAYRVEQNNSGRFWSFAEAADRADAIAIANRMIAQALKSGYALDPEQTYTQTLG
jgi:hypothetical protein